MWVQRIPKLYNNNQTASPINRNNNKKVKAKRLQKIVAINDSMEGDSGEEIN